MAHQNKTQQKDSLKLPPDVIEASCTRLTSSHRKTKPLPDIIPKKVISNEEMERQIQHLYDEAITTKKVKLEKLERKVIARDTVETKVIDRYALESCVTRLYNESMARKDAGMARLMTKYGDKQRQPQRRLDKTQVAEIGQRLCNISCETTRDKIEKLYDAYVTAHFPKAVKKTPDEIRASSDRMHRGERD